MIKMEQLYYLVEVEKYHSITLAAEKLFLTKAAISTAIKQLEKECGFDIFTRSYRGVSLTPEGELVFNYATQILNLHNEILNIKNNALINDLKSAGKKHTLYISKSIFALFSKKLFNPSHSISSLYNLVETDSFPPLSDDSLLLTPLHNDILNDECSLYNIKVLFQSKYFPVSCHASKWISSETKSISLSDIESLPFIVFGECPIKSAKNIALITTETSTYINAILNDLGIGLLTTLAEDIYIENRKKFKFWPPVTEDKLTIALISNETYSPSRFSLLSSILTTPL